MGFLIPGSLVRVQPGVLELGIQWRSEARRDRDAEKPVRWFESSRAYLIGHPVAERGPKGSRRLKASPLVRVQPGVLWIGGQDGSCCVKQLAGSRK